MTIPVNNRWALSLCVIIALMELCHAAAPNTYRSKAYLGGTFQLTCTMGSDSSTRWEKPLGNVIAHGPVLKLENIQMSDAGIYACLSNDNRNGMFAAQTLRTELVVVQPEWRNVEIPQEQPRIINTRRPQSVDRTITLSETELLYTNCRVTYGYGYDYLIKWLRPDGSVAINGDTLYIESVSKRDEGEYTCQVTDRRTRNVIASNRLRLNVKVPETQLRVEIQPKEKLEINGWISRRCVGFIKKQSTEKFFYAWINSKGQVVSVTDMLELRINDASKFGTYQCQYRAEVAAKTFSINSIVA